MAEPRKPSIPGPNEPGFDAAVKETLEIVTGRRPNLAKVSKLASTATTADIINKVNEILDRLQ